MSVWDLDGSCPYYKVTDKISVPQKKVLPIIEMKYPKSKDAKPVYFLLLKLFKLSDNTVLSRNFYWLYLSGNDYQLLEPYRKKKIPLKITSQVLVSGSSYKIEMHVQNTSKSSHSTNNGFKRMESEKYIVDYDINLSNSNEKANPETDQTSGLNKICRVLFSRSCNYPKVLLTEGADSGVAFFLHFSVHAVKKAAENEVDDRILPVHYSDNYFSLVPGETLPITIFFKAPEGVTPRVVLNGWNFDEEHSVL